MSGRVEEVVRVPSQSRMRWRGGGVVRLDEEKEITVRRLVEKRS